MHLPVGPEALTAAWLTATLRQNERLAQVTVLSFEVAPLAESKGFFGQLARIHLSYQGDAPVGPSTLIAKFSSATPEMRQRSVASYEREVRFYQQLARTTELATPTCYHADINLATGDHILLLQDLAPLQSGSRIAGCTPAQARLAIHHIAKLHTTWWGRTAEAELDWLTDDSANPPTQQDADAMRQSYDQWWPLFYEQAKAQLPETLTHFSATLGSHRALLRHHLFGTSSSTSSSAGPRTLIHRDFQMDNLFFDPGQTGGQAGEQAFAIVDWQFLARGRAVWDVAYLLTESMTVADRRLVERELLASHHQALIAHGAHDSPDIGDYTFKQYLYDYQLCLLQRHTALVSTIAVMPFSPEQRHIHTNILLPRNIAAILDHQAHTARL